SGGTPPYEYTGSTTETTASITNLPTGVYSVTVVDDNLCQSSEMVSITAPDAITFDIVSDSVNCFGGNDGSLTVINVTGGIGTYEFDWSKTDSDSIAESLTTGTYQVTVTDANGCEGVHTEEASQPAVLVVSHTFQDNDGAA